MRTYSKRLSDAIFELVRERLNNLTSTPVDQLTLLPSQTSEDIVLDGEKVSLSVWHDVLLSNEHRFVIQAYKPGLLGMGRMFADGFVLAGNSQRRILTVEEWAPFS